MNSYSYIESQSINNKLSPYLSDDVKVYDLKVGSPDITAIAFNNVQNADFEVYLNNNNVEVRNDSLGKYSEFVGLKTGDVVKIKLINKLNKDNFTEYTLNIVMEEIVLENIEVIGGNLEDIYQMNKTNYIIHINDKEEFKIIFVGLNDNLEIDAHINGNIPVHVNPVGDKRYELVFDFHRLEMEGIEDRFTFDAVVRTADIRQLQYFIEIH